MFVINEFIDNTNKSYLLVNFLRYEIYSKSIVLVITQIN